jgi:hypothetical protein
MSQKFHIDAMAIERVIAEARAALKAGSSGSAADECYVRLGDGAFPAFMRWHMREINADTDYQIMGRAITKVVGWMLAQCVISLRSEEERMEALKRIASYALDDAVYFALPGFDPETSLRVPVQRGGTA